MRACALRGFALLLLPGLASGEIRASFTLLDPDDSAYGISADAQVAVGIGPGSEAIRWSSGAGTAGLGYLPGGNASTATAANADGSVLVGWGTFPTAVPADGFSNQAFRWTASSGMVELGILSGGYNSIAEDVSADGSVVVGSVQTLCDYQAFRWTNDDGMVLLDSLGCSTSLANGVSADGSTVVGARFNGNNPEAFRWTAAGGMVGLGYLPEGDFSVAHDVSADGSVLVGISSVVAGTTTAESGREAFRWTAVGGMAGLGFLPGHLYSNAEAVSADGSVVVGWALGSPVPGGSYLSDQKAFIWTGEGGLRPLYDELVANGATGLEGWDLVSAQGISADGLWVVGQALSSLGQSQAFLAYIDPPDLTPNPFFFLDRTDVPRSAVITSGAVTITGITGAAPVTVTGGEYSVGCGADAVFTSAPGTVSNGEAVCVRHTSATAGSTATSTTLMVGRVTAALVTATFSSTTVAAPGGGGGGGGGGLDGLSQLALGLLGWMRRKGTA